MDRSAYIVMTGAKQTMLAQAVLANNLANVSTTGFRGEFATAMSQPIVGGDGFPTRAYAVLEEPTMDLSVGKMMQTGRDLDVAIDGDGWIAVEAPDETEALTRSGDFKIDPLGRLMTASGLQVMGAGGPITIPAYETLEISNDGIISIRPLGSEATEITEVDQIKLVNPEESELKKFPDGLIRLKSGEQASADGKVKIVKGFLESSNVNAVDALTQIVALAREYDIQVKMLRSVEDNSAQSSNLLRNQ